MRKIIFVIGVVSLLGVCKTFAIRTEKLNLKGGVTVEGHVQSQTLGKSVTFSIERTYATVNSAWIADRTTEKVDIKTLKSPWKEWIDEQKSTSKLLNAKESIYLSKIKFADKSTMRSDATAWSEDSLKMSVLSYLFDDYNHQVFMFEEGAFSRFVDLTPKVAQFNYSDIRSIEYKERDPMALNGIVDVVELKNVSDVSYKGQIIEKVLGKLIRIKTNDGIIHSVLNNNIRCIKKEKLNPNVSILKQTQFLDIVNGTQGIIVCHNTSSSTPFIQMIDEEESQRQFDMKDVTIIRSYENKDYDPMHDIVIKGQNVYVNRHEVHPIECTKKKDVYTINEDHLSNIPKLKLDSIGGELIVEMVNLSNNSRISLLPLLGSEVKGKMKYEIPNELFADGYVTASSQSVSVNNTLRLVYKVKKGLYAIYVSDNKKFYFCEVN